MPDPMTDHPTAGARPDVDAIEERLELSRSPECQVAGEADDQLIVFDIPDLIAYTRTLETTIATLRRELAAADTSIATLPAGDKSTRDPQVDADLDRLVSRLPATLDHQLLTDIHWLVEYARHEPRRAQRHHQEGWDACRERVETYHRQKAEFYRRGRDEAESPWVASDRNQRRVAHEQSIADIKTLAPEQQS